MTDESQGLNPGELDRLSQVLTELPELINEATAMGNTRLHVDGQTAPHPGPRPPLDLTLIAAQQSIEDVWDTVYNEASIACVDLNSFGDMLTDLAGWADWYTPCWWAHDQVLGPLWQIRAALRQLLHIRPPAVYPCPSCTNPLTIRDGGAWMSCGACGATIDHHAAIRHMLTDLAPLTQHATDPALPSQAALYRLAQAGRITPLGHDSRGNLYSRTQIITAMEAAA